MARLILQTADGQQTVELTAHNSLGRHPSNTIQLLDKIVSKEHCTIELRGTRFVLRDLGSLNGTFINKERVQGEQMLNHGDEIALGQTKARFEETGAAQMGSAPPSVRAAQAAWAARQAQQHQHAQQQQQQHWQRAQAPPSSYAQQPVPPTHAAPPYSGQQQGYPPAPGGYAQQQPPSTAPRRPPPPPAHARGGDGRAGRGFTTAYMPRMSRATHVDADDEARQIGAELKVAEKDFRPYDDIARDPAQLRADYERLRMSYELTRDIADEKDTTALLEKILKSVFRFIPAQRGVIFLLDSESGDLTPCATHRNDGSTGPISVSTTIMNKAVADRKAVLTHDAAMDFAASKGKSMILNQIQSAVVAPMLHADNLFGVLWLDSKSLAQFQPKDLELVSAVANQAAMFIEINILGRKIQDEVVNRERLSRLLSPNVAEQVMNGKIDVQPGGARTDCTVFNSDIRGFTAMSEHTSPEELVEMLNAYFEEMVDVIFKFEGTLDKFMGDGIMALWGAPLAHPDDPERAVECAIEQCKVLETFNAKRVENNAPALGVGLGIHTGPVVAGYIGSSKALSYTVIGDVANTSARLCSRAKAGEIIVSEATKLLLPARFELEELEPAKVKGKAEPMRIWNVTGTAPKVQVPGQISDEATESSQSQAV